MPWAKNWELRYYIKEFRIEVEDKRLNKGVEARYTILDYLIMRANPRLRTRIGVETIMEDTGFTSKEAVAGALAWLFDRGAIYNVPPKYRVGDEAKLHNRKYVFQLTGVINLGGKWIRYLYFSPEDAEMMMNEWQSIGMELKVDYDYLVKPAEIKERQSSHNEPEINGQGSLNEPSSDEHEVLTPSSKGLNVPKGTLRPAKAGTQPPVITGRSGGEDDPPDPNVEGYTAAELWVYHNQKTKKPLSDSMRGRLNNPPSHLNDKGIVVADETVNKLFDTDKAYPIWCVEWVLPALKNTIGANQKYYKPSPSSLIDFMRKLDKFYEWKAKQPEARFKPLRKIISSV